MDKRAELIQLIIVEIERIFGEDGFDGDAHQYEWLLVNCSLTEEDDVQWQQICEWERGEFGEGMDYDDVELAEREAFLENEATVIAFLERMLTQYRTATTAYTS